MKSYYDLLRQLRTTFKNILKTQADYETSIKQNEDGLFLSLYKIISECQILVAHHLNAHFERMRLAFLHNSGAGSFYRCSPEGYLKMLDDQNQVKSAVLNCVYIVAFEFYPIEERVFREKLIKELATVETKLRLKKSS